MGGGDEVIHYNFLPISVDVEVADSKPNLADVNGPYHLQTASEVVLHHLQDLNALGFARIADTFVNPGDFLTHI